MESRKTLLQVSTGSKVELDLFRTKQNKSMALQNVHYVTHPINRELFTFH